MTNVVQRLAVLLTCHNRRERTLSCVQRVEGQRLDGNLHVDVIVVDDGSTDGTYAAIRERFPSVVVIEGTGNLYWNGGMRVAFGQAIQGDYDYYLLLNDDTELEDSAFTLLLETYRRVTTNGEPHAIIVGSTREPVTGALSYGGWRSVGALNRIESRRVEPSAQPVRCDTMNANCVLLPRAVIERVGFLDEGFTHSMGDIDYGLRAAEASCTLWVAPGYVGTCAGNSGAGSWKDPALPLLERWRRLLSPKGLPPREWLHFTRRHGGPLWPMYWANPYVKFWLRALTHRNGRRLDA